VSGRSVASYVQDRPLLADSLFAIAVYAATIALDATLPAQFWPANVPAALVWSALGTATIAIRRRLPWLAIGALAVHSVISVLAATGTEGPAIIVITYTAAAWLPVRQSAAALAVLWVPGLVAATVLDRYDPPPMQLTSLTFLVFNVMVAVVAYLGGRIVFTRRRYVAALVERASTAEENQEALTAQAVSDERRRIARELHDMVAHHVSVMGVLASGSRRMLGKDPAAADEALATIEESGRTALREMRRLLDVLRTETPAGPDRSGREFPAEANRSGRELLEPAPMAPHPDLAGLKALVEQVCEAGLAVTLQFDTPPDEKPLDPGVALTVYRIVQEALTNVLKHGGADARAEVRLDVGRHWLTLEVFDTGRGPVSTPPPDGGVGHGLLGMRERVALFGGTLRTGPRPGGGFRVYARIPLEDPFGGG
jgi:signal transduction histidine kinase